MEAAEETPRVVYSDRNLHTHKMFSDSVTLDSYNAVVVTVNCCWFNNYVFVDVTISNIPVTHNAGQVVVMDRWMDKWMGGLGLDE